MEKRSYLVIGLFFIIFVFLIFIILFPLNRQINETANYKRLNLVFESQQKIETIILDNNLQLNNQIKKLSRTIEEQSVNLNDTKFEIQKQNKVEIEELKSLIATYIEEVQNKNAIDKLHFIQRTVETDNSIYKLLKDGALKYKEGNFSSAVKLFQQILELNPSKIEAILYFNASLYYQNPGDGSNYFRIKNDLISLLDGNTLTNIEERTVLNVLIGISREEDNIDTLKKHQDALMQIKGDY